MKIIIFVLLCILYRYISRQLRKRQFTKSICDYILSQAKAASNNDVPPSLQTKTFIIHICATMLFAYQNFFDEHGMGTIYNKTLRKTVTQQVNITNAETTLLSTYNALITKYGHSSGFITESLCQFIIENALPNIEYKDIYGAKLRLRLLAVKNYIWFESSKKTQKYPDLYYSEAFNDIYNSLSRSDTFEKLYGTDGIYTKLPIMSEKDYRQEMSCLAGETMLNEYLRYIKLGM